MIAYETRLGKIVLSEQYLSKLIGNEVVSCFGVVGMAGVNVKDGLVKILKMDSITRGIVVKMVNNKLVLDFHVIVAYGVSISAVSDNLISNVKYKVEEFTGIEVSKVNVFVEGVRAID